MSLSFFSRRMSVALLAGVERQGRGSVGCAGAEVGLSCSIPFGPSTVCGTHPFSVLQPTSIRGQALEKEVQSLVQKGALELAPLPSPSFYNWIFVVMKASGSWRPVIDLSILNLRVCKTPFKMETLQSVHLSVWSGDWMVSIYLKDAYLQVPVHPDNCKYLRFWL